jgi:hypothetical protein
VSRENAAEPASGSQDPDELASISGALAQMLAEAHASITDGEFGHELERVLYRARTLYERLVEGLEAAGSSVPESVSILARSLGANLTKLEVALREGVRDS